MPNEYKQVGNQRIQVSDEKQAEYEASRVKTPEQIAAETKATAMQAVAADFEYNGVAVGMTDNRLGFYQSTNANAATLGDTVINGSQGGTLYLATPQEINDFHSAVVAEMATRKEALKAAMGIGQ